MSTDKKYDIIDSVLLKRFLEKDDFDNTKLILSSEYDVNIDQGKRSQIFNQLVGLAEKPTFGSLIGKIETETVQSIAKKVGISEEQLERIYRDEVLINRIPITRLKVFLETLNLSYEKVKDAIIRTSEILSTQSKAMTFDQKMGVAFRRKMSDNISTASWGSDFKSDLFDNNEALSKYLDKLNELMS
ncbi:hypothetical protein [Roseivirga sp. UBA838]|uniref:hypothetical protein n=1 Tax=Roseivirga sp. UBA838 TaxID=1947393 RepID=UPI002579CEA1|nr:hypothetical protein [Roseivirga sp. UBA838]|tara:strand:- start:36672 stop:37232 length:561 start_codon:yes stop_codon:yes gene_type:complete